MMLSLSGTVTKITTTKREDEDLDLDDLEPDDEIETGVDDSDW